MTITAEQFKEAARKAVAAGDTATARKLIARAKAAEGQPMPAQTATSAPSAMPVQPLPENPELQAYGPGPTGMINPELYDMGAIGRRFVPGQEPGAPVKTGMVGDIVGASAAGGSRGVTSLMDLPSMAANLSGQGAGMFYDLIGQPQLAANARGIGQTVADVIPGGETRQTVADLTGGASEYKGQSVPAQYAGTIGEFIGGGSGAKLGAAAGIGAETAGQFFEQNPIARAIGGFAGAVVPSLVSGAGRFAGSDEASAMANRLTDSGVRNITTGQAKGSPGLMAMEGRLQPTATQLDDFTATIMGQIGSTATKATPDALRAAEGAIVKQMDNAVAGVSIAPTASHTNAAADIAKRYVERVPAGQLTPRVRGIAAEIAKANRGNSPVELRQLKEWRSDIGNLTVSADAATREAAHALRTLIDDMTDAALTAAGRQGDIAMLAKAREAYRNFIGIRDAASRAGAEAGVLSPQQLNQSIIRSQGREAYATGRTTPMTELTRAGAAVLRPAPSVNPGGQRSIAGALSAGLASAGGLAGYSAGMGVPGAIVGGLAGAAAPIVGQAFMRSGPIQGLLRNPMAPVRGAMRLLPGALAQ